MTQARAAESAYAQRAVVVTAASSRVGRATAAQLARRGDLVLMGTRRPDICERLATRLRAQGATAFTAYLDFADTSSIDRFIESARYLVGGVDMLVTDAGLSAAEVHVVGAQHLVAQLVPSMIRNGRGDVVLVSPDIIGSATSPRMAASAACRRALDAWVSGLDAEFVGTGVRVAIVRSGRIGSRVAPDDVACLIAAMVGSGEPMQLRLVEVISAVPASTLTKEGKAR